MVQLSLPKLHLLPRNRPARRLSPDLSLYLDVLRTLAAMAVFLGHARDFLFPRVEFDLLFGHAREAVAVFFVLSGFVITYVVVEKESDWRAYAVARLARIYSVALPAIAVTVICDLVGRHFGAAYYDTLAFPGPRSLATAASYLAFANQLWFGHVVFGTNEPYWSLGFEVWYYVAFGLAIFLAGRVRGLALLAWAVICGPKILLYFPLWLFGVALYAHHARGPDGSSRRSNALLFLATPIAYALLRLALGGEARTMFQTWGLADEFVNVTYFTAIGGVVAFNIVAVSGLGGFADRLAPIVVKSIRWIAGASFTLYLTHLPIVIAIRAIFPAVEGSPLLGTLAVIATLALVLLLAEIGERRKKIFAALARRLLAARVPARP